MKLETYKTPVKMRSAHLTCPLALALESYWACEADCFHCVGRRLNKVWGYGQRCTDPEQVRKILTNALKNPYPKTIEGQALYHKKAFFFGRKADPYQPIEIEKQVTRRIIEILIELDWPFAICSRYQANMERDEDLFLKGGDNVHILTEITPGAEADWELFERERTTPVEDRMRLSERWKKKGIKVGVRGEPYIPGYHTLKQFKDTLKRLKSHGLNSYNIYNLHINEYTIKRFYDLGLDIEKIWTLNQDEHWAKLQKRLCIIAQGIGITLGCPDFVNVPKNWYHSVNTCCGLTVKNALTFNTHNWRNLKLRGKKAWTILAETWEVIGTEQDIEQAKAIVNGKQSNQYYTFKDAGL